MKGEGLRDRAEVEGGPGWKALKREMESGEVSSRGHSRPSLGGATVMLSGVPSRAGIRRLWCHLKSAAP